MGIDFYTNPMSRGQIVRWMLEEVDAHYEQHIVDYSVMGEPEYAAVNPMGKVPAIVHDGKTVTECAAIIAYLADVFPAADLAPREAERADYYRWLFFTAGPVEQAITARTYQFEPTGEQGRSVGFGSFERTVNTLAGHFANHDYVCGSRFTAADVYVGSQVMWGIMFGTLPALPSLEAYRDRLATREPYLRAKEIDTQLIANMQDVQGN